MTLSELRIIRLHNQRLLANSFDDPHDVVSWMGAMQSQALELAKWAIGVRLNEKSVKDVEEALNCGSIIRTHILRPTWHFVTAEDFYWMSELSNPRLKPVYISYCRMSGANEELIIRALSALERIMATGEHLTKQEIGALLNAEKVAVDDHHVGLAINRAEVEGMLCNGKLRGNKQTYTRIDMWIPRKERISREEALERLARKFFTSHGPASLADFVWWSGLTMTDCRKGLGAISHDFVWEKFNGREFWMRDDKLVYEDNNSALLLPPFDEFVVSYKDRSEIIEPDHYGKVMTKNGLFSPTIMLNGEIVGSWKKITKKSNPEIELSFFEKMPKTKQKLFEKEIERVRRFY